MDASAPEDDLTALAEVAQRSGAAFLSPVDPVMLDACAMEIARDTRSFARIFDVAHAFAIRECVSLDEELGLLSMPERAARSQRLFYALTETGEALLAGDAE